MLVPVIPESAPFSTEQRAWLNGYLAGLFSRAQIDPVAAAAAKAPTEASLQALTILFGSQTGTAESLAKRAAKEAGKHGFAATVRDMAAFTLEQLAQERAVLVITSTYGDGEPPDNAKALHGALNRSTHLLPAGDTAAASSPLANVRFSVCGLGDSNYARFCQCARDLDTALEKLGARRIAGRVDCDVDYEAKFTTWLAGALQGIGSPAAPAAATDSPGAATSAAAAGSSGAGAAGPGNHQAGTALAPGRFSRANPFPALIMASRNLNSAGSAKQVHHVEFDLADSGLAYEAGDALGVYAQNCPELVDDVLAALRCDGEEAVPAPDGGSIPLRRALGEFYDLGKPTPELLERLAVVKVGAAARPVAPHQVIDAVLTAPEGGLPPAEFVARLKRLQPRLYSISSSPRAHSGRIHATVGAVRYELHGRSRKGVCSTFLADRVQPGESRVGVFVHRNPAFRLPADAAAPVIMVGPGTGVAPFRGFLHERRAAGARGRNWLFFGDQRSATDFLYREELETLQQEGVLSRLDTAFSRDQAEKIYVQHRMLENAAELYAWLEDGGHFYVCGDASRMAKDVDGALREVVARAGGRTPEQAAEYVDALRAQKRYARDVY